MEIVNNQHKTEAISHENFSEKVAQYCKTENEPWTIAKRVRELSLLISEYIKQDNIWIEELDQEVIMIIISQSIDEDYYEWHNRVNNSYYKHIITIINGYKFKYLQNPEKDQVYTRLLYAINLVVDLRKIHSEMIKIKRDSIYVIEWKKDS